MKGERKQYEVVKQLPKTAVRVKNYADGPNIIGKKISVAYVYKLHANGKIRIVEFEDINFVVP